MEPRSKKKTDFGEIVIFATLPMRNQCFCCPWPLQKIMQNLFKKKLCNQTPQNPQFSTSGRLWMATWAEKVSKRGHFCCPKLSWGQDGPQESPSLDFGSSSNQFRFIFTCFRNLFYRLVSFLSAPAVGRGNANADLYRQVWPTGSWSFGTASAG